MWRLARGLSAPADSETWARSGYDDDGDLLIYRRLNK